MILEVMWTTQNKNKTTFSMSSIREKYDKCYFYQQFFVVQGPRQISRERVQSGLKLHGLVLVSFYRQ
jgi:hypothetical protein